MRTEVHIIDSDFCSLMPPDGFALIGLGYPVHAFNAPHIIWDFARWLMTEKRKPLFLFHTGGEGLSLNDASSLGLRRILSQSFDIISERHYIMPYNMIFRHDDRMVKHMVTYMRKLVKEHAEEIEAGKHSRKPAMPLRHIISAVFRIEWLYARVQGRTMKAGNSCTGCSLCASICPMKNIRMENGRPVFGTACSLCVRCSFSCPHDAITIGLLNGWKVNGPYPFGRIMADDSIPETIPTDELSFLYRRYYRNAEKNTQRIQESPHRKAGRKH